MKDKKPGNYPLDVGTLVEYSKGAISYTPVMAYLNQRFKEHVASLCGTLAGETQPRPMGTCFFIQTINSTGLAFDYLVTAKHVVEQLHNAGGPAYMRVNKGKVGEFNRGVLDLQIPTEKGWLYHSDPSVDLAVLPKYVPEAEAEVESQKGQTYRVLMLKWESLLASRAKAPMWPPGEAEAVMFVAMTTQFQGERANLPTVRRGHLSLVTKEPIKGYYGPSHYYVVEAQVYPGNSGAPVWVELTDRETKVSGWHNLGVLVFSYPAEEELKMVQGVQNAYYNLGLSLVVPIEKLEEIVDSKEEKDRREKIKGPYPPGVAISASGDDEPFVLTREGFQGALRKVSRPEGKKVIEKRDPAS